MQQTIGNQLRGSLTLKASLEKPEDEPEQEETPFEFKEKSNNDREAMVCIEIQNSKFDVKARDASRLNKLSQEQEFSKILESKCDINFKIARVITNAVNWTVDFNAYKSGKLCLKVPAKKYEGGTHLVEPEEPKFIEPKLQMATPMAANEDDEEKESPPLNLP